MNTLLDSVFEGITSGRIPELYGLAACGSQGDPLFATNRQTVQGWSESSRYELGRPALVAQNMASRSSYQSAPASCSARGSDVAGLGLLLSEPTFWGEMGVSRERVRQFEAIALAKLRRMPGLRRELAEYMHDGARETA